MLQERIYKGRNQTNKKVGYLSPNQITAISETPVKGIANEIINEAKSPAEAVANAILTATSKSETIIDEPPKEIPSSRPAIDWLPGYQTGSRFTDGKDHQEYCESDAVEAVDHLLKHLQVVQGNAASKQEKILEQISQKGSRLKDLNIAALSDWMREELKKRKNQNKKGEKR